MKDSWFGASSSRISVTTEIHRFIRESSKGSAFKVEVNYIDRTIILLAKN